MRMLAAVVLAGGGATRMGGIAKPARAVAGIRLIDRVLSAAGPLGPVVVVGPPELDLPPHVLRAREDPPGSGPVAALGAGLAALTSGTTGAATVVLLGGDLPFVRTGDLEALVARIGENDGAAYVDPDGRHQWMCSAWRWAPLATRLAGMTGTSGRSFRSLVDGMRIEAVRSDRRPPPWFDCDTEEDLLRAEGWA